MFFSPVFLTRWCLPFKKKFVEILQGECSPCSLAQFVLHSPLRVTPSSGVGFGDWVAGNCGRCGFHTSRGVSGADVQEVQQRRRGQGSVAVCPRVPWCPLPGSLGLTAGCGGSPCQWPVMQDTSSANPVSTLTNQTDVQPQLPPWWRRVGEFARSASWKQRPSGREGPMPGRRDSKPGLVRAAAGPKSAFGDASLRLAAPPRELGSRSR